MFFRISSATFSFADVWSFHHKKYPKLKRLALSKNNVNHISLFSHTHTHIIHARRTVVVDLLLLLLFFCYYIYLKKNGEIIGNVPLGRANSVWIGLLGWGKFVLVHVVVFAFEREEYESECW